MSWKDCLQQISRRKLLKRSWLAKELRSLSPRYSFPKWTLPLRAALWLAKPGVHQLRAIPVAETQTRKSQPVRRWLKTGSICAWGSPIFLDGRRRRSGRSLLPDLLGRMTVLTFSVVPREFPSKSLLAALRSGTLGRMPVDQLPLAVGVGSFQPTEFSAPD